jgi:hypothetical protein
MALTDQALSQIHELQATLATEEGILLMAFPVKNARALMDAVNFATERVPEDDLHVLDMQIGASMISDALTNTGLMYR